VRAGPLARATFTARDGKSVVVALRPELPRKLARWIAELGVEQAGRRCLALPAGELFSVTVGELRRDPR
jgi:hypothetical protein